MKGPKWPDMILNIYVILVLQASGFASRLQKVCWVYLASNGLQLSRPFHLFLDDVKTCGGTGKWNTFRVEHTYCGGSYGRYCPLQVYEWVEAFPPTLEWKLDILLKLKTAALCRTKNYPSLENKIAFHIQLRLDYFDEWKAGNYFIF